MGALLEIRDFSFSIGGKTILDNVSLSIEKGGYLSIVGPNGAGKSTLLKCVNRILAGGTGRIALKGRPLAEYRQKEIARLVGYVPQADGRVLPFSAGEFVLMGRYPHLSPFSPIGRDDKAAAEKALDMTGVAGFADRPIESLSGGERQRVFIAAALAQEAELLLLDEPTTFLDPRHESDVSRLVARLNREHGIGVAAVTHDINRAALAGGRVAALRDGRLVFEGEAGDLMTSETLRDIYGKDFVFAAHPVTGGPIVAPDAMP